MEPTNVQERIYIGPAGWSYPDWKTTVLREVKPPLDPLTFMSTLFNVVEINNTFYRIPSLRAVDTWIHKIHHNKAFLFTVKLYRPITHDPTAFTSRDRRAVEESLERLQKADRLGAVLAQFPYRFHNTKTNRQYLVHLRSIFPEIPLVVEFRHRSWLQRAVTAFLAEIGLSFCNIDQPQVSFSLPLTEIVTLPTVSYLRCHGRNAAHWFGPESNRDTRYHYRYKEGELRELAAIVNALADRTEKLFVIFNNHYMGNEVFDAMTLAHMLGLAKNAWPPWWPRQHNEHPKGEPEQCISGECGKVQHTATSFGSPTETAIRGDIETS